MGGRRRVFHHPPLLGRCCETYIFSAGREELKMTHTYYINMLCRLHALNNTFRRKFT